MMVIEPTKYGGYCCDWVRVQIGATAKWDGLLQLMDNLFVIYYFFLPDEASFLSWQAGVVWEFILHNHNETQCLQTHRLLDAAQDRCWFKLRAPAFGRMHDILHFSWNRSSCPRTQFLACCFCSSMFHVYVNSPSSLSVYIVYLYRFQREKPIKHADHEIPIEMIKSLWDITKPPLKRINSPWKTPGGGRSDRPGSGSCARGGE